jgi:hypothetical protein
VAKALLVVIVLLLQAPRFRSQLRGLMRWRENPA